MPKQHKIQFLTSDDWQAMYFNGRLVEQGHSLDIVEALELLVEEGLEVVVTKAPMPEASVKSGGAPHKFPKNL